MTGSPRLSSNRTGGLPASGFPKAIHSHCFHARARLHAAVGGRFEIRGSKFKIEFAGAIPILPRMSATQFQARRATLEDLGALQGHWEMMRFPAGELEKQLTDFQVVTDAAGVVVGAIGFQIAQRQGRIHSESFSDFSLAEKARPLLWERIQSLCTNHGITRLWTLEQSPFWARTGFQPATATGLEKLPEPWDRLKPGWHCLQLRDDQALATLDKEFAMFVASEKQRSEAALGQAKVLKTLATIIALLIAAVIFGAAIYVFMTKKAGPLPP
jgi:N-acetylglutamate synthase-like GNAT family acetyltransferase